MRNTKTSITQLTMTTSLLKRAMVLAMAWLLAAVPDMALAQGKPQQQKRTANAAGSARAHAQQEEPGEQPAENRGGPHDGIKIHGHWVIEVHNPDGSLASHTEFENALAGGAHFLALFLTRNATPSTWQLVLDSAPGVTQPCNSTTGIPGPCIISDPAAGVGKATFATLQAMVAGAQFDQIVLSGNATAGNATAISVVTSEIGSCDPSITPSACTARGGSIFSQRTLGSPVPVAAGQIIQVTVTFTFS